MPTITLPDDTEILLDKLARHRGVSREAVLASFVEAWVEDMEDHVWAITPLDFGDDEDEDDGPPITSEEMIRELEMADRLRSEGQKAA